MSSSYLSISVGRSKSEMETGRVAGRVEIFRPAGQAG